MSMLDRQVQWSARMLDTLGETPSQFDKQIVFRILQFLASICKEKNVLYVNNY